MITKYHNELQTKSKTLTNSLIIAEYFEKRHDHVLEDIRELLKDLSKEVLPNFRVMFYQDKYGRKQPYYELTRDAWMLLVMGYRGKKALSIKEQFIKQFNRMEEVLRNRMDLIPEAKIIQRDYTDFIQFINSGENKDDMFVKFSFKFYIDLIYKKVLGETGNQRRKRLQMKPKTNVANTLTPDEMSGVIDWKIKIRKKCIEEGWVKLKPNDAYKLVKEWLFGNEVIE